jgi:hypothetical protein
MLSRSTLQGKVGSNNGAFNSVLCKNHHGTASRAAFTGVVDRATITRNINGETSVAISNAHTVEANVSLSVSPVLNASSAITAYRSQIHP